MAFDLNRALSSQREGKALPYHPTFADRTTPVSIYSPGRPREDAVISQRNAPRHADAYGGAQAIDHVYDAINLYADPVSTADYRLEKDDGTKLVRNRTNGTPPDHDIGPADLYKLLDKPNPFMGYDEMLTLLVIDLMLVGNAYWFKWRTTSDGKPLALYRLAPAHVKIVPGEHGPKFYEYQPPGVRDKLIIKPEGLLHFRRPNPHSPHYGMGVIQGAGRAMDIELAITDTMASYYENKADPSLIIQSDRRIARDVFNKLRAQLRARAGGSRNAGELLVLEAGLKASSLSTSASDALFEDIGKMSRDRILAKFRANPMLFGLMDEAGSGSKIADARREFDVSALQPFMIRLQNLITSDLSAAWGVKYRIDYQSQMSPEDAVKVNAEIAKVPGIKVRELRRLYKQFGIEESTGDPEIDEMVLNLPGEELGPDGEPISGGAGFADRGMGSEAGRPPKGENTKPFPKNGGALPAGAKVRRSKPQGKSLSEISAELDVLARAEGKALSGGDNVRVTVGNVLPDEQRPSDTFADFRTREIDSAQNYMTAELRDALHDLERGLLDVVEGKALKTTDLVGRIKKSKAWIAFKDRVQAILEEGARRSASAAVMHSGLTPDEEIDYDAIVKSTVHRPDGLAKIIRTLRDRVSRRVSEARDAHAERGDFEAAVRSALAEWSESQAVTIADSEATEAYNEATLTVVEMSGGEQVYVTDGDEHDEPCLEANGQVWDVAYARANRKEHPRCRRAFLPLAEVS